MHAMKKTDKPVHHTILNSDCMVTLFNLSGSQRMLSQRMVLNLVMSRTTPEALVQAKEGLVLFSQTHALLVEGNHEYPGMYFEALEKVLFGPEDNEANIRQF